MLPLALTARAWSPEPLRREDAIAGRDIEYNEVSFLHRFTYRYRPAWRAAWQRSRDGLRGTAGSVRGSEFYVREEVRHAWLLNERWCIDFHHRTDEDFDGPYTRTLTGIGANLGGGWSAAARGDLAAEKEEIDAHGELAWHNDAGLRLRMVGVLTDAAFNRKADAGEYRTAPVTWFGEARWLAGNGAWLAAYANHNAPSRFAQPEEGLVFADEQNSAGARAVLPLTEQVRIEADLERGETDRSWDVATELETGRATLAREYRSAGAEVYGRVTPGLTVWAGWRRFELSENQVSSVERVTDGDIERNETMVHAGVEWTVRDGLVLWPGIYLNNVDNRDSLTGEGAADPIDDEWTGKLTFPIEIAFRENMSLTVNPTLLLHEPRFGGGNVQMQLLF